MKTIHKITIAACVLFFALLAVSCLPKTETMGDAGQTLVKLHPDSYSMLAVDAKSTSQTGLLFEVRKDAANAADLNSPTTVVLKYDADTSIIKAYNLANGTSYIPLPSALGTVSPAITAGQITLNFAAGEFSKSIMVTLPSSGSFDFSAHYALAFKVLSVTGTGKLTADLNDQVVVEVLAKNRWDGIYTVTGTFEDYVYELGGTVYPSDYPETVQLRTIGAMTCARYDADAATYSYVFNAGGNAFGNFTPSFVFDASNNVVNCVNTSFDPPARSRTCYLFTGAGSINKWNAADKSMDVTWGMTQQTVTPKNRNLMTEHYTFKGPR